MWARRWIFGFLEMKFFRFLLVGGVNTLFGYGMFALFIFVGCHYGTAVFLATVLGVLFNFKTLGRFVFRNENKRLIYRFVAVYVVVYLVNVGALRCFEVFQINMYFAGAVTVLPMAVLSFLLNNRFVYRNQGQLRVAMSEGDEHAER